MRRKNIVEIMAMLQHLRAGASNNQIKRDLKVSRHTARAYRQWATEHGLLDGALPPIDELERLRAESFGQVQPPQNVSTVAPHREFVLALYDQGVEMAAIYQRLDERGFRGSYSAVYRFVRRERPKRPDVTVRVECQPGEEAQVDFGYAGYMLDLEKGKRCKSWAFVMTLSYSRHQYVEFVFDQKLATWLRLHRNALAFFGGVPRRIVIDNLKAGIAKACWEEPQPQLAYRECAEHYGFLIAPCKPKTPQHKGKVEQGGVHYVKRNFLGGREPTSLVQANRDVRAWCLTTAGQRTHGTTKKQPLTQFEEVEQAALQPLPVAPYDLAIWKKAKLHDDCYVVFENAYYSGPFRLVGEYLFVRGGSREVRLYNSDYQLVATHERAQEPGQRQTHPDHLPPEKITGVFLTRETCQAAAGDIGPATAEVIATLLADTTLERLPMVRRLLAWRDRVGDERLEAACSRALRFGDPSYKTVKGILQQGLESAPDPDPLAEAPPAKAFVRNAVDLFGQKLGRLSWN
jgi:transposase